MRHSTTLMRLAGALALALFALAPLRPATTALAQGPEPDEGPILKGALSGLFVENVGQWDEEAEYRFRAAGSAAVWFTQDGFTLDAISMDPAAMAADADPAVAEDDTDAEAYPVDIDAHNVGIRYIGASEAGYQPVGDTGSVSNWFFGEDKHLGARAFERLERRDLYPGIDAHYTFAEENGQVGRALMKATYLIQPGSGPDAIAMEYTGADAMSIDDLGQLVVETSVGSFVEARPFAYQVLDGNLRPLNAGFTLEDGTVGYYLDMASAVATEPIYLDPTINYQNVFGGSSDEWTADSVEDGGDLYHTGFTFSSNLPNTAGTYDPFPNGSFDWYVCTTDLQGSSVDWCTYLGGSSADYSNDIEINDDGNPIIVGYSFFSGTSFPTTGVQPPNTSAGRIFDYAITVAELSSDGTNLVRAVKMNTPFASGSDDAYGHAIAVDDDGNYFISGATTNAGWINTGGYQTTKLGSTFSDDGLIMHLVKDFSQIVSFTYMSCTSTGHLWALQLADDGDVVAYGDCFGTVNTTETIGGGGGYDHFVMRLDPTLSNADYVTEIGGSSTDYVGTTSEFSTNGAYGYHGLTILDSDEVFFASSAFSTNYPDITGFQGSSGGGLDQVAVVLSADGSAINAATYIGGSSSDYSRVTGVDEDGNLYVAGHTLSSNWPTTVGEVQTSLGGSYDWTRAVLTSNTDTQICGTYFGSSSFDFLSSMDVTDVATTRLSGQMADDPPGGADNTTGPVGGRDVWVAELNCGGAALALQGFSLEVDPFEARPEGVECVGSADFIDWTITVENTGLSDQLDLAGPEAEGSLTGPHVLFDCTASSGECTVNGNNFEWNGFLAASGGSVDIFVRTRVNGATPSGLSVGLEGTLNFDADGDGQFCPDCNGNETSVNFGPLTQELNCFPTVNPNAQLGKQVHLPILNFQGQDDVCRSWIEVQYIGCDPSKAVLVTWGEPGFCPPQAAGPLKVECTGLLNPGSTWNLLGAQIPTGSKSGILFKFTAQQLSDVGLDDDLGFDDVVADLMCETLFFGVVGDSDDYRRFKKAYNEGLDFAGIDQGIASGEGILAVEVLRHCPGDVTPGVEVSSKYNGIAGTHLGTYDPIFGGYGYYVPLIYAEKAGLNTVMYIQNGGLQCSSIEIWFKAQDDCLRARICEIFTLAPGETYQWDASDCVGPDWQGSAWLRSSQVMGIAVDIFGRDILMTYTAEPQPFAYVIEGDDGEPEVVDTVTTGEKVAFGPLMYSEYQGWDTGVQVQNLSEVYNAKVKVYFLDRSGDVITTLVDWVCPRGSQTFFLPVVADLPGTWVGSIRIESQDWWTPGTNPVDAPNIVGVATLMKYSDAARTDTQEAIAYNLIPEHKSYIWQVGSGSGGVVSGVGLIAIPSLLKDLDGTGTTSEVAIMNLVAKPGFTDFAIYIYDQNGLLDFICQKLHREQVEYIDLQTWGYVNNGFKGSAIISATFWEHDVFTPTGQFVRNLVGLGAVMIERTGTRLGEDVPGDEAAGARGVPFEVDMNIGPCLGGFVPTCPGQPEWNPQP